MCAASISDKKICSRCHIEKGKEHFRIRMEKRATPPFRYLNNTCRACDAEITRLTYKEWRKTPEGRKINQERARAFYKKWKDRIKIKMKEKRKTDEYKRKVKAYRMRNKEKIAKQEVITKRRHHEKNKEQISDAYVLQRLKQDGNNNPTAEEIEIKRSKILIHRIKQKIEAKKIGRTKICSICKQEYDLSQFWRTNRNSNGRVAFCRACGSIKNQEQQKKRDERHCKPA